MCCNLTDSDGQCDAHGTPHTCDYECASIYPAMFDRCESLLRRLLGVHRMPAFVRLYHTCSALPTDPLIRALGTATGCDTCSDKKKNGDETHVDCGGSCGGEPCGELE